MATLNDFINTDPSNYGADNANLLVSGSGPYTIKALTFPVGGTNSQGIKAVLQQVNEIRFIFSGSNESVSILDRQELTGTPNYFYFLLNPTSVEGIPTNLIGGLSTEVNSSFNFIPYFSFNFLTNDFNILINNSERSKLSVSRRIVDRNSSQSNPTNLNSIISQSATFAEIQECNYTKQSVINARYKGSKLDNGSIPFNDPALAYIPFQASLHGINLSYEKITSIAESDRELTTLYFNPVFPGDLKTIPTQGRPVYKEEGNRFVRIENRKFYAPEVNLIGVIGSGSVTSAAVYSDNQAPSQPTGSLLSPTSPLFSYVVSNYDREGTVTLEYFSGSLLTVECPPLSTQTICASAVFDSTSGLIITKTDPCT